MTIIMDSTECPMDSTKLAKGDVKDRLRCTVKVEPTETAQSLCFGCGLVIQEKFILSVGDNSWHSHCLRCSSCNMELLYDTSCFIREDKVFCKTDFTRVASLGYREGL